MAYEDSFGFTHLVEDSDDDDQALDMSNSHLDVDLQPHLTSLETVTSITERSSVGDAVEHNELQQPEHNSDVISKGVTLADDVHSSHDIANGVAAPARRIVSVGDNLTAGLGEESAPASMNSVSSSSGGNDNDGNVQVNDSSVEWSEPIAASATPVQSNVQVQFSNAKGEVQVVQQPASTRPDGSYYINTHGVPVQWSEPERPLHKRRILLLKIFSIIACVFFFPSGIPAAYYAFRINKEINEGIMRGNIDQAQKFAKRSERLIILSIVLSVVLGTLIVALIERPYSGTHHHTGTSGVAVG